MNFLRLLPAILSLLLLAAHFYRGGQVILTAAILLLPLLLFVRKAWVAQLMQMVLVVGAIEWLHTLWVIADMRMQFDMPWMRMAAILGGVALFTGLSALVFRSKSLKERYS